MFFGHLVTFPNVIVIFPQTHQRNKKMHFKQEFKGSTKCPPPFPKLVLHENAVPLELEIANFKHPDVILRCTIQRFRYRGKTKLSLRPTIFFQEGGILSNEPKSKSKFSSQFKILV